MNFSSVTFLFAFFPICIAGYYLSYLLQKTCPLFQKYRIMDIWLIAASLGFYSWACFDDVFKLIIYVLTVYMLGIGVDRQKNKSLKSTITTLSIGIVILISILYYYKYVNFSIYVFNKAFNTSITSKSILAPLGISFITFSAISYLADIKRSHAKAGNLLDAALYLTFFPKVISGPIVLWKDFNSQISSRQYNTEKFVHGINRIIVGMAKKVILADSFGLLISTIQADSTYGVDAITAWGFAFLYMLQIYYDFAGYSDIAIGLSELFGFHIEDNFNFPYISQSISEFWRRWHISLGRWFKEYIYIPLGGNRKGFMRTLINLFIVFLITGIWHGAGFNYILWGTLNGVCVVIERCIQDKNWYKKIPSFIKWMATMFTVFISWQIFRFDNAINNFKIMFGITKFPTVNFTYQYYFDAQMTVFIIMGILGATLLHNKMFKKCYDKINTTPALYMTQEIILLVLGIIVVQY